jgi:uncharacterized protein (DUF779 family)
MVVTHAAARQVRLEAALPLRVIATPEAAALIMRLRAEHGPLIFHQSGGCCEGSAPMCFRERDFRIGSHDVLLGVIEGCPFYVAGGDFEHWAYFELTIDVTNAGGDSFSIEAADGVRFVTRSRLFSDAEAALLDAAGPPSRGPEAFRTILTDDA